MIHVTASPAAGRRQSARLPRSRSSDGTMDDSFRMNDITNILNSSLFEAGNAVNGIVKMEPPENCSSNKDGSYENNDGEKGHKGTSGSRWTSQWR
eukprot:scaffold135633_cov49-Attheya_sp.AAC.1